MDSGDGVAVKIESRFGRVSLENMMADRADVFPLPGAKLFALAQPGAMSWADIIVTPITAAWRESDRSSQGFFGRPNQFSPGLLRPIFGGDSFLQRGQPIRIEQQARSWGQRTSL